ncbi:hypothetical protein EJV46_11220 [Roseococcus sp. SYP-B2431]|nr:hypothetical protein EJV46_11220 [Roseococcus sp. SYP-B2431]
MRDLGHVASPIAEIGGGLSPDRAPPGREAKVRPAPSRRNACSAGYGRGGPRRWPPSSRARSRTSGPRASWSARRGRRPSGRLPGCRRPAPGPSARRRAGCR